MRKVSGKIKMDSQIANIVELGNTMIKQHRLLIAKIVELENTMIKRNAQQKLIVNLIAMPDHTLHLTKVHVLFVRKVSGKIKMDSQIANIVELENTMIKEHMLLIAKIVQLGNTMIKHNAQQSLIAKIV